MAKTEELKFELLPHAPYSPDLAPSDYFLFPNLKKWLGGKRFASNEDVETTVNAYFEELDGSYYRRGIEAIEHRWEKCIYSHRKGEIRYHYTRCTRRFTPGTCAGPIQPVWTFVFSLQNCTERLGCPREPRSNRFLSFARCRRRCQSLIDLYTHIIASDTNASQNLRNDTQRNESRRFDIDTLPIDIENYDDSHELHESEDQNTEEFNSSEDLENNEPYLSGVEYDHYENADDGNTLEDEMLKLE
ncbi:unnamed protein product [Colias eurytheme]|nr:unnamed protein product [Colias eurytheme]